VARLAEGESIYNSSLVYGEVKVGENTWIGLFTDLDGSGDLEIDDCCSISAGVCTHDSMRWAISGGMSEMERAPTKIGSRCYIGSKTVVTKGESIGDGCVIGAPSLVLSDIPGGNKAYGIPCKVRGKVS